MNCSRRLFEILAVGCMLLLVLTGTPCAGASHFVPAGADTLRRDTLHHDSIRTDTLREVVVRGDSVLPVKRALDKTIRRGNIPHTKSLGDVIEKLAPGINDKITHPFAVKQRKAERRKKKLRKALDEYDRAKTFNELLDEAVKRQQLEDERARREAESGK